MNNPTHLGIGKLSSEPTNLGIIKLLLVALLLVTSVFLIEGIEHAQLSRGITCELYYIQGQVNTAKSLDFIIEKVKDNKKSVEHYRLLKEYLITVAKMDGITQCIKIDHSFIEVSYYSVKNWVMNK